MKTGVKTVKQLVRHFLSMHVWEENQKYVIMIFPNHSCVWHQENTFQIPAILNFLKTWIIIIYNLKIFVLYVHLPNYKQHFMPLELIGIRNLQVSTSEIIEVCIVLSLVIIVETKVNAMNMIQELVLGTQLQLQVQKISLFCLINRAAWTNKIN